MPSSSKMVERGMTARTRKRFMHERTGTSESNTRMAVGVGGALSSARPAVVKLHPSGTLTVTDTLRSVDFQKEKREGRLHCECNTSPFSNSRSIQKVKTFITLS